MDILTENARLKDRKIILESGDDAIRQNLFNGNICVFKGIFSAETCRNFKKDVISWANNNKAHDPKTDSVSPTRNDNWHRYDNNPAESKTPHIFHAHNFDNVNALPEDLAKSLKVIFTPLIDLQNRLAGTFGTLEERDGEYILHPQVIHYPQGGGYFGRHIHPLEPQRFGLIVDLSEKGTEFTTGSTLYYSANDNGEEEETALDSFQNIGSLTIFRYDIPHAVSIVDENSRLTFDDPSGRWVAILPYY